MVDGGWDVIIIELKQYLQAITSAVLTRGLDSLSYLPCQSWAGCGHLGPTGRSGNTRLNLNENQGGVFDDLFKLTMNVPINILILMESHLEN